MPEAQGAFRHQQDFLSLVFTKANAGGELWARIWIDSHGLLYLAPMAAATFNPCELAHLSVRSVGFLAT